MEDIRLEWYDSNKLEIIVKDSYKNNWEIRREKFGFSLEQEDLDSVIDCSIIDYVENANKSFVSMVCKQGKLPIRMTSFRSDSNNLMKDINDGIQDVLKVPKELFLDFILERKFGSSELLKMLEFDKRFKVFDYALPQNWLDDFFKFIEKYDARITYNLICSTTVWCYGGEASEWGKGVSVCAEVNRAIERYTSYRANSKQIA